MGAIGGCFLFLVLIAVFAAIWAIWRYNNLISLKYQVANAWKQIDVQLKRRHDLIPNLIAAVKGEMQFEQDTLEKVIAARNSASPRAASRRRPRRRTSSPRRWDASSRSRRTTRLSRRTRACGL